MNIDPEILREHMDRVPADPIEEALRQLDNSSGELDLVKTILASPDRFTSPQAAAILTAGGLECTRNHVYSYRRRNDIRKDAV